MVTKREKPKRNAAPEMQHNAALGGGIGRHLEDDEAAAAALEALEAGGLDRGEGHRPRGPPAEGRAAVPRVAARLRLPALVRLPARPVAAPAGPPRGAVAVAGAAGVVVVVVVIGVGGGVVGGGGLGGGPSARSPHLVPKVGAIVAVLELRSASTIAQGRRRSKGASQRNPLSTLEKHGGERRPTCPEHTRACQGKRCQGGTASAGKVV